MDDGLRAELLRRMKQDQDARNDEDQWERVLEVDAENLPWLKQLVAERGWLGNSTVGADGARAMWLLAQHADADPAFQRECLNLLTAAVEAGEATREQQAFLTDRVLLHEGQQQVYGTQVGGKGGQWVPRNLRDPDGVDERRATVGLEPLAEYLKRFTGTPTQPTFNCPGCGVQVPFELPEDREPFIVTCPECGRETTVSVGV